MQKVSLNVHIKHYRHVTNIYNFYYANYASITRKPARNRGTRGSMHVSEWHFTVKISSFSGTERFTKPDTQPKQDKSNIFISFARPDASPKPWYHLCANGEPN